MPYSVQIRALEHALEITGSADALCAYLGASPRDLEAWLGAEAPLPGDVFLRVVDLLHERQLSDLSGQLSAAPSGPPR
jgi:hypothetical protein